MAIRRVDLVGRSMTTAAAPEYVVKFNVEPYLFGGGSRTRRHDPVSLIRAPSILGHVRWFWRLMHADLELEDLRKSESNHFGAASVPASFALRATTDKSGTIVRVPHVGERGSYLLFAGREEKRGEIPQAHLSEGVAATIRISHFGGELDGSIIRAFKLWSMLGGVGARTRRGIGSVQVVGAPATREALESELRSVIGSTVPSGGAMPALRGIWIGAPLRSAQECLWELEKWYKNYRQDRRPGTPRPGRSYWDEPELIRHLTKQRAARHQVLQSANSHAPGWARAALGLPIVFQFKDAKEGDPDPTTLQGKDYARMASPLLFRPFRLSEQEYVPVVVLIEGSGDYGEYCPPGGLVLTSNREEYNIQLTPNQDRVFADLLPGLGANPRNLLNLERVI